MKELNTSNITIYLILYCTQVNLEIIWLGSLMNHDFEKCYHLMQKYIIKPFLIHKVKKNSPFVKLVCQVNTHITKSIRYEPKHLTYQRSSP